MATEFHQSAVSLYFIAGSDVSLHRRLLPTILLYCMVLAGRKKIYVIFEVPNLMASNPWFCGRVDGCLRDLEYLCITSNADL